MKGVECQITIRADAHRVLDAFLDVSAMRQWWGVHRGLVEPRVGGAWACTWDVPIAGFGFVMLSGIIHELRPGERLRIEHLLYLNRDGPFLGPMRLDVDVSDVAGNDQRSLLEIRQVGGKSGGAWDWYHRVVVENWPPALARLKEFLEATKATATSPRLRRAAETLVERT